MAISNIASNLRPGVVTSTTRPTSPYEGQMIYETDTKLLRIWDGSAWDYVGQSDAQAQSDLNAVGLWRVTPSAVSGSGVSLSGATVVLTAATEPYITAFSADFEHYRIIATFTAMTGAVSALTMRMANGTSPNTTAANYRNVGFEAGWGAATLSTIGNNGATAGWNVGRYNGSTQFSTFIVDLQNPFATKNTAYNANFRDADIAGVQNGYLQVTTSYNAFNPRLNTGGAMTGTIEIYGYNS